MAEASKRYVVSLGGSLIVPNEIDVAFLQSFSETLRALIVDGYSFLLIPGGGATARNYQRALRELSDAPLPLQDGLGIKALTLNAALLHGIFADIVHPEILSVNSSIPEASHPLIIAAGAVAGRSSDAGSVELACAAKIKTVINLSNVDRVYAGDPKLDPAARSYEAITWSEYRTLIPAAWDPGQSTPFDPIASRMAQEAGLTVAILNGHDMPAFARYVREGVCVGTLISPQ